MADRLEAWKVMSATGHTSGAVFEVYADHASEKVFQEVSAAAADTFGKLVTFPAAGASAKNGRVGGVVRGDGCGRVPGLPSRVPALLSCPGMRSQGERRAGTRDSNPSTPL